MLKNIKHLFKLSEKYNIPTEDLLLLDLNLSGAKLDLKSGRVRFELESTNKKIFSLAHNRNIYNYYLAIPTVDKSSYHFKNNKLYFNKTIIGKAIGVTEDYCDSSYPRRGATVLNINPNARTSCRGCKFCYTAFQVPRDKECMLTEKKINNFLNSWMKDFKLKNLSNLQQVAIVTGCFPSEQNVVEYLIKLNRVLRKKSFRGEIFYFGSQIKSKSSLKKLAKLKPFGICYSLECFDNKNREYYLRDIKKDIDVDTMKKMFTYCDKLGIRVNYSYIVGLESLKTIKDCFIELLPYINSFPIVNTFQSHKWQEGQRHNKAHEIDYYIKARKIIEKIYKKNNLRPRPWENYRSLWYLKFDNEYLDDIRTPLSSTKHEKFNKIVACKE